MQGNGLISDRELPICWANRRDGVVRACRNRTLYPSAVWSPLPEIVLDIDRAVLCIRDVLEPSLNYALCQTRMVILSFDAWCSIMKNISLRIWAMDMYCVITLLLSIGTVQGSTDICLFLVQIQLRYIYLY